MVGGRHPVHSKYSVGFGNDGRISAIKVQSWLEGGFSLDFSSWIPMSFARAILQYDFGDVEVQIKTCKYVPPLGQLSVKPPPPLATNPYPLSLYPNVLLVYFFS